VETIKRQIRAAYGGLAAGQSPGVRLGLCCADVFLLPSVRSSAKLYWLVTAANVCEQLVQGRHSTVQRMAVSHSLTTMPLSRANWTWKIINDYIQYLHE